MTKLRCSSLPYLMTCTNSVMHPEGWVGIEGENDTALLGTLAHALCESVVATGEYDLAPLRQRLSDTDYARVLMLFNNFLDVWKQASAYITEPVVEKYIEAELGGDVTITGHLDVHQAFSDRAFIIDYKTGRQHENHYHQMAGYAYAVWWAEGSPEQYTVYVSPVYLEDKTMQPYTFTVPQLEAWAREVREKVKDKRFVVGRKCSFCSVQHLCKAYQGYVGAAASALMKGKFDQKQWEEMTPEERGHLADRMYVLEKAIDRTKLGLRHAVRKAGSLDIGGGNQYELIEQEEKGVDPTKAVKLLSKRLPDWHRHARFRLNDVLTAVAATAPRGEKTKAKEAFLAELEKAGAVIRATSSKMYRRPVNEVRMTEDAKGNDYPADK